MVHRWVEDDCVGPCPQGCINCGRKHTHYVEYECDECGERSADLQLYENDDGEQLCTECALGKYYIKVE